MTMYWASVKNEDNERMIIKKEYKTKKHFISDLRGNGYKVAFVATEETFDAECEKYNERRTRKNRIAKYIREAHKKYNF